MIESEVFPPDQPWLRNVTYTNTVWRRAAALMLAGKSEDEAWTQAEREWGIKRPEREA